VGRRAKYAAANAASYVLAGPYGWPGGGALTLLLLSSPIGSFDMSFATTATTATIPAPPKT
jgi:hypothetical protein